MLLKKLLASALALCALAPAVHAAEDSALLKILVKKGILTQKEALNIEAESQQQATAEKAVSTANKLKLSDSLTELRLYGDVRLRYQYENKDYQVDPITGLGVNDRSPSGTQRSRWRFRLRLNGDFKLGPDWFGGVELQTGYASDSSNQTFENGFSDYPIFISKAYFGYNAADWLQVVGGKQPNPFYTTDLVWDPDINPAGLVERVSLHKLFGSKSSGGGLDKDGKSLLEAAAPESPWEVSLVAGQFIFDDNFEGGGRDPGVEDNDLTDDVYLFETQLIASYKFNKNTKLTIAPAWLVYTGGSVLRNNTLANAFGDINENSFTDAGFASGAQRHLNLIQLPGDVSFNLFGIKSKVYWDFAYNIEGKSRAEDIYQLVESTRDRLGRPHNKSAYSPEDSFAWMIGFQLGENKKKGDLSFLANYRRTGIASVDPNINDNDFALSELNTQGFKLSLAYNVTNFSEFRVTYMPTWNLDKNLTLGEATNDNAIADSNAVQMLQVDLTVKF
jgi:hypothetical protein